MNDAGPLHVAIADDTLLLRDGIAKVSSTEAGVRRLGRHRRRTVEVAGQQT